MADETENAFGLHLFGTKPSEKLSLDPRGTSLSKNSLTKYQSTVIGVRHQTDPSQFVNQKGFQPQIFNPPFVLKDPTKDINGILNARPTSVERGLANKQPVTKNPFPKIRIPSNTRKSGSGRNVPKRKIIVPPDIEQFTNESCWAAAFSSFLQAVGDTKNKLSQKELIQKFKGSDHGFDFRSFRYFAASLGMDTKFITSDEFSTEKIDQLLREHGVLFIAYLVEEAPYWWHDVLVYDVTKDSLGVGVYKVMNPSFKRMVNHTTIPFGKQSWTKEQFFPKDTELIIGWKSRGPIGTVNQD